MIDCIHFGVALLVLWVGSGLTLNHTYVVDSKRVGGRLVSGNELAQTDAQVKFLRGQ